MQKKTLFAILAALVIVALVGYIAYLTISLNKQKEENAIMQELAEMDKLEMENQYEEFALQYSELKTQITNDSLIAQLEREQQRTQELLEELRQTKANDAAEIARLKKELATLRHILRSYVHEIDSLNLLNQTLMQQNAEQNEKLQDQQQQISDITNERESLAEMVTIAAQLDATDITLVGLNKKDKPAKKVKEFKRFAVSFKVARNITAQPGDRTFYVRLLAPNGSVLTRGGRFDFEDRQIEFSCMRNIEYTGEETVVTMYYDITETLQPGTYRVQVFADGNNIGKQQITFAK